MSIIRGVDLVLFVLDAFETHIEVLVRELEDVGIRLNQQPPDIVISKKERGGNGVHATLPLTNIDEELIMDIMAEYGHINSDIVIREDITVRISGDQTVTIPASELESAPQQADDGARRRGRRRRG